MAQRPGKGSGNLGKGVGEVRGMGLVVHMHFITILGFVQGQG